MACRFPIRDIDMRFWHSLGLGLAAILFAACEFVTPICPASAEPAIIVEVRNAATGVPEARGVDGTLREESYTDSLRVVEETEAGTPSALAGGFERGGTYTIRLQKDGFETWTRDGVHVEEGECGPDTRRIRAELKPTK